VREVTLRGAPGAELGHARGWLTCYSNQTGDRLGEAIQREPAPSHFVVTPYSLSSKFLVGHAPQVLVTGGCGFIGRALVSRLIQRGCSVVILDDLSTGVRDETTTHERVSFHRGSVLSIDDIRAASAHVDLVIHLAGLVGKALAVQRPDDAYRVSVEGTRNVLSVLGSCPTLLVSSSAVYGVDARGPVRETEDECERHASAYDGGKRGYAVGKLHMEVLAREEAARGRPTLVVRPFNVVGPGQSGRYGMVLPRFLASALAHQPLVVYGDGRQTRSFTHIRAFVDAMLSLVEAEDAWQLEFPIVNIGAAAPASILSLAQTTIEITESKSPIQFVPYESVFPGQRDVPERTPDTTVMETLVGRLRWPTVATIVRDARDAVVAAGNGGHVERRGHAAGDGTTLHE
jgi:UDP-glucose 4-epimerase